MQRAGDLAGIGREGMPEDGANGATRRQGAEQSEHVEQGKEHPGLRSSGPGRPRGFRAEPTTGPASSAMFPIGSEVKA